MNMTDLAVHALLALIVVQALLLCLLFILWAVCVAAQQSLKERFDKLARRLEDRYGFDIDDDEDGEEEYTPY